MRPVFSCFETLAAVSAKAIAIPANPSFPLQLPDTFRATHIAGISSHCHSQRYNLICRATEENMHFVKKLSLAAVTGAFCFSLFAATSNAQYSRNRTRTWTTTNQTVYIPQNRTRSYRTRSYGNRGWQNQSYRYSRISPREYRRLQRQRYRVYRSTRRAYRDGYVNQRERRRISRQSDRYNRRVYRSSRNW